MATAFNLLLMLSIGLICSMQTQSASVRSKKEAYDTLKEFGPSLSYRPPPPLVRRDVTMRVKYDPERWIGEAHMTIVGAVMFDRSTGLTVDQCLEKCTKVEFQNTETRWICRSLTYDHKWKICDLFAIDGSSPPYFLSEYKHRDYFKFLAALPPADHEFHTNASKEMSAEVQAEEKKFDDTTTTTLSPFLKDSDTMTTSPPSDFTGITEPFRVEAAKKKFESNFNSADTSKSKEDVVKVLASKQTGDSEVLEHAEHETLSVQNKKTADSKVAYHRKPSLKFAITPIATTKSGEEVKSSIEQLTTVSSKETTFDSTPELSTTTFLPSTSEEMIFVDSETPSTTQQTPTPKNIETRHKAAGFVQIEEESLKTVEVIADIGPINNAQQVEPKRPRKKIQGITTHAIQNTNSYIQKTINNACKSGEVARYIQIQKHERLSEVAKKIDALQLEDCAEACTSESTFQCKSAVFQSSTCSLFADSADHGASNSLSKNEKSAYLERTCIPQQFADSGPLINEAVLNYILVGQVQEVSDAQTLEKCQIDCLTASKTLGFVCKSAMFYPTDIEAGQNCLLNSEDHKSKSNAFVVEDAGVNMIYFAVGGDESDNHKKQAFGGSFQNMDNPIKKENDWSNWSKCNRESSDAIRHRYMKCTYQKDIRKCPKQSAMCKPPSLQIKKISKPEFECRAVRSKGRKLCPHGFRYDSRGMRHYCIHPVDC